MIGPSACTGSDACPGTPGATAVDANGCSDAQVDADGDGVCDDGAPSVGPSACTGSDLCPGSVTTDVDVNGCSSTQALELLDALINDSGLANAQKVSLSAILGNADALLTDGNTANDAAACGKPVAFINKVNGLEASGALTSQQAAEMRATAEALMGLIGC